MADLDKLLRSDLSDRAAEATELPDFASIERTGVRRRRTRSGAAALAVAAAVVGVALATTQLSGSDQTSPPPLTPPTTPTAPSPTPTDAAPDVAAAVRLIDDPRAQAISVVVAPENPQIRAVLWRVCDDPCEQGEYAIALTDDGFRTRTAVPVHDQFPYYVGEGVFAIDEELDLPRLLHPDGRTVQLTLESVEPSPVEPGEVISYFGSGILRWAAADPATGVAHVIDVPRNFAYSLVRSAGDRLSAGLSNPARYTWSQDGGATWQQTPLDASPGAVMVQAASREGEPIAVLEIAELTDASPLAAVHRSTDGGRTFERIELGTEPRPYGSRAGVLPDGRLLLNVEFWADSEAGGPPPRPSGLYVSNGDDWSDLVLVDGGKPYADSQPEIVATEQGLLIVYGHPHKAASTDGGRTWQQFSVR